MTATATAHRPPQIRIEDTHLQIQAPGAFAAGRLAQTRHFARRVLGMAEVRSLSLDPARGQACLSYRVAADEKTEWLRRLAAAVGGEGPVLADDALPAWPDGSEVTLTRSDDTITTLRTIDSGPDWLRVTTGSASPLSRQDGLKAARALATRHGVLAAETEGNGIVSLHVRFDPTQIPRGAALRAIEEELAAAPLLHGVPEQPPVDFGLSNTTLGLSTVGEIVLPAATPLAAGILVANKLSVIRDAAVDLSRGRIGVPLFDTALLTCSIVTGQVLAYALTDWSLRFWQQRRRRQLTDETRRLAQEASAIPPLAQRIEADSGALREVSVTQIVPGDRIRVTTGHRIPADGRVVDGIALVDAFPGSTQGTTMRRTVGDAVLAGCVVRAGELVLQAEHTGPNTHAGALVAAIREAAVAFPREATLERQSEQLAERSVVPTLATAGVGWAAGDLITVGAILHQDWISGPALAVPLLTIKQMRDALGAGVLIRNPTTLQRLAESDFIVLDGDEPALAAPVMELTRIDSAIPDVDEVLRQAAAAGMYLGDERGEALTDACRARGLAVRQAELEDIAPGRVGVRRGQHQITLVDDPSTDAGPTGLLVGIDSHVVGRLGFGHGKGLRAASAVQRLRAAGLQTGVIASAPDAWAEALGQGLGTDLAGGQLQAAGKLRFLEGLRRRGLRPVYVGPLQAHPELSAVAHAVVDTGGLGTASTRADALLLAGHYESLADLVERSRTHEPAIRSSTRMATVPNLLCVAGAFAGLLNGITAGMIANVGVLAVDRDLRRRLRAN